MAVWMTFLTLVFPLLCAGTGDIQVRQAGEDKPLTKLEELAKFHKPIYGMSADERLRGYELRLRLEENSPFKNIKFRSVGPEIQGGRIVDLAVPEGRQGSLLVAFATGGLWRTDNLGTTWKSLFDNESALSIGAIAVSGEDAETIWVGTGEANSSRTSYAGTGIFKSTDGGETWRNMGLRESHHIGRIVVHPENPDIVYVAAIGHLYTWNIERGVYRTSDGGETWKQVLSVNERTGAIDVAMHPRDPDVIYASMWERDRRAWNFLESGEGSGIYNSRDGGGTWTKLTDGLPVGQYVGRMGFAISRSKPDTMYVVVDNQATRPEFGKNDEKVPTGELSVRRLEMMTDEQLLKVDKGVLDRFLRGRFPADLTADRLIEMMKNREITVNDLLNLLRDANAIMFSGEVIGAEVYRSDDGGETWTLTHEDRLDRVFNTYGYYFGRIGVSPTDPDRIFILGVPILASDDGGETWESVGGRGVHADHHAIWIDPRWPDRVALGNDGGLNLSWDGGKTWQKINNLPVGQFTTIAVDMAQPYRIYGGLQDNGTMRGPHTYSAGRSNPWDWEGIGGGDGASVVVDTRTNETFITSSQFGSASGRDLLKGDFWGARPSAGFGEPRLRYNWVSPIVGSVHHGDIVYYGANRLYRSMDFGRTWTEVSDDLTSGPEEGDVPFGTFTAISESPKRFGVIYVGTDEGLVWRTMDGGVAWTDITKGLAKERWVTRVVASPHDEATVFVSQNGYRQDDFAPYLWISTDYGDTWISIANGLPAEPINVVREDPKVEGLLYVGTDLGVFVSFDMGETWEVMAGDLPHVPVHDLAIHPRDSDIALATHGRSVFVADIDLIQQLTTEIREKDIHVLPVPTMRASSRWGYERRAAWDKRPVTEPTVRVSFWLKEPAPVTLILKDKDGAVVKEQAFRKEDDDHKPADYGFNFAELSLLLEPAKAIPAGGIDWQPKTLEDILKDPFEEYRAKFLKPGEYTIEVRAGDRTASVKFTLGAPQQGSGFRGRG